uniref:Uncharacterized protein n=1 Tax=Eutreptiella gymnastica TaxID=73025 RepID=A0A7S4CBG2_9EUGL
MPIANHPQFCPTITRNNVLLPLSLPLTLSHGVMQRGVNPFVCVWGGAAAICHMTASDAFVALSCVSPSFHYISCVPLWYHFYEHGVGAKGDSCGGLRNQ